MAWNPQNYGRIVREFEEKGRLAREQAKFRADALYVEIPELGRIGSELAATGVRIMAAITSGGDVQAKLAEVKAENQALQKQYRAILVANGYPENETEPHYECALCGDTGYAQGKLCDCMRRALILAGYESAGISVLMRDMTFENYRTDYFLGDGEQALSAAMRNLEGARQYAELVEAGKSSNLLLIGGTGLGKTHLSVAIARRVVERGFDVVYETAQNIFSDFENERFQYGRTEDHTSRTDRYFACELLLIDDLGTEVTSQFTASCLYNLINTRLQRGLSTVVNTNLSTEEIRKRYTDRIASRLFGSFTPLLFRGNDVRAKKLKGM